MGKVTFEQRRRGGKGGLTSVICRKSIQAVGMTAAKALRRESARRSGREEREMSLVGYWGGVGVPPVDPWGARDCSGGEGCCQPYCWSPGPGQAVGPHL